MTHQRHLSAIREILEKTTPPAPRSRPWAVAATPPPIAPANLDAIQERIEERAAILEFDAGESRENADRIARATVRVYRVHVAMGEGLPPRWATFIAPGCDLEEATEEVRGRFGADRVIKIIEQSGQET